MKNQINENKSKITKNKKEIKNLKKKKNKIERKKHENKIYKKFHSGPKLPLKKIEKKNWFSLAPFYIPGSIKNLQFCDIFRGYKRGTPGSNGFNLM